MWIVGRQSLKDFAVLSVSFHESHNRIAGNMGGVVLGAREKEKKPWFLSVIPRGWLNKRRTTCQVGHLFKMREIIGLGSSLSIDQSRLSDLSSFLGLVFFDTENHCDLETTSSHQSKNGIFHDTTIRPKYYDSISSFLILPSVQLVVEMYTS